MTTVEEISALTQPNHPDDWTDARLGRRRHRAGAGRRCGAEGRQRPSRYGDEPGPAGVHAVPAADAPRPQRRALAGPRPLRAVLRAHQPDAVHPAVPRRLRPGALRHRVAAHLEVQDARATRSSGTPRAWRSPPGPLGQGLASAVGMAMAARYERGLFDPDAAPGDSPFDHFIYVIASDGDMEEGVTSEASSLAGTQQLGNLIVFYDNNQISIEHDTNIALSEDVAARYRAYGWHVQEVEGGENVVGIEEAIEAAKAVTDKPSFIAVRTIIGYPAPTKMNTGGVHGSALGDDEVAATKKVLGFDPDKKFEVRDEVIDAHPQAGGPRQGSPREVAAGFRRVGRARARAQEAAGPAAGPGTARGLGRRPDVLGAGLQGGGHPRRVRPGAQRRRAEAARIVGRLSRSRGQQQHHHQGCEVVRAAVDLDRGLHRRLVRPGAALRHPRARDGLDPVRHRAARPDPRLRRHVPAVLRLHAARRCGWRR